MSSARASGSAKKHTKKSPAPAAQSQPGYLTIRDRFISRLATEKEEVAWLVAVGKYVQHCWLVENYEHERNGVGDFDDMNYLGVWDECREEQLEKIQANGLVQLTDYRRRKTFGVLARWWVSRGTISKGLAWAAFQAWKSFVGAVGLVIITLCLSAFLHLVAPDVTSKAFGLIEGLFAETPASGPADKRETPGTGIQPSDPADPG